MRPEAAAVRATRGNRQRGKRSCYTPPKPCEIAPMTTERRAAAKLAAPTINLASIVYGLDAYMRARGADTNEALRRAGLEPADLTDPERRAPLVRYLDLLEICADLLGDPQFGLKF